MYHKLLKIHILTKLFVIFQVRFLGNEEVFSPEQIMAMLLTKLKLISEKELATKVTDCVVSVSILTVIDTQQDYSQAECTIAGNSNKLVYLTTSKITASYIYQSHSTDKIHTLI